jgi:uncharacterized membrane protein YcfT
MTQAATPTGKRIDWVDYAKGICILWVVALYATDFVQSNTGMVSWMQTVGDFAQPFRMPDFFLLSGLFVARVLNRPLRAYIDSKVLYFVYFYLIWATLKFVNMNAGALLGPDALALLPQYLHLLVEPPTGPLWFIYILAVFFIVVRLVRNVPPVVVLAVAAALQISDLHTGIKVFDKFSMYFVFFYSGYLFSRYVFQAAEWALDHARLAVAVFAMWFAVHLSLFLLGWTLLPGLNLVLGYAGAGAILLLGTMCSRKSWMNWLAYLGRNSIVVYLGFVIPLGLLRRFVVSPHVTLDIGLLALLVTALSIIGALLLYWSVRHTPLRFLFVRPVWASIQAKPALLVKSGAPG